MNIKEYVLSRYHIVLTGEEYQNLEKYLLDNINNLKSNDELKLMIRDYVLQKLNYKNPKFTFSADNTDLEQALLILKNKGKNDK